MIGEIIKLSNYGSRQIFNLKASFYASMVILFYFFIINNRHNNRHNNDEKLYSLPVQTRDARVLSLVSAAEK